MPNIVKCRVVFDEKPSWAPALVRSGPLQWDYAPPPKYSFDHWVPRPPNLLSQYQRTFRDLAEALGEKSAAHLDEVEWMRREWGTSGDGWDFKAFRPAASPAVNRGYTLDSYVLDFNAAWSAPLPVFLAMAKRDGPLRASWYEEFGQHAGHLRFEADKDQEGLVVATEVVKVYRGGRSGYRGVWRIVIGERFVPGAVEVNTLGAVQSVASFQSVDAYLTELRAALYGEEASEVPLVRGDFDE